MKILITGGGTSEPIDSVRYITNFSTGKTSSFLADFFAERKNTVTALMAENAVKPLDENIKIITFKTFCDLKNSLESECKKNDFDAIIHAAAVSDFSVGSVEIGAKVFLPGELSKISSEENIVLRLEKNPKILCKIKNWSGGKAKLIAFKLTSGANEEEKILAVKKLFESEKDFTALPDFVVQNDKSEITESRHSCAIYAKSEQNNCFALCERTETLEEFAESLEKLLKKGF